MNKGKIFIFTYKKKLLLCIFIHEPMQKYAVFLILILLTFIQYQPASAQLFGSRTDSSGLVWRIRFNVDGGTTPLSTVVRDSYAGEYYNSSNEQWVWRTWDSTRRGLHRQLPPPGSGTPRFLQTVSGQLNVSLNLYENLYIGFNYTPLIIQDYATASSGGFSYYRTIALIGLGTSVGYDFVMPFHKRLSAQPVITLGGYADVGGEGYYEGLGNEWFKEARLGIAYRPFKYDQFRLWASWSQFSYRENLQSVVFIDRNRTAKTDISAFYIGIGYVANLYIKEDIEETNKTHKKNRKNKKSSEESQD